MKISILVCTFVIAFLFKTNAMVPDLHKYGEPFVVVHISTKPHISVIQIPKQNQIVFDEKWRTSKIEMEQGDIYKDVVLKAPLRITGNMHSLQFFEAVHRSFEKPCRCIEGWCRSGIVAPFETSFLKKNSMLNKETQQETPFFLVKAQNSHILKFPTAEEIIFDGVRGGKVLRMNHKNKYKDLCLQKDLYLRYDMTNATFLENICEAVNQPCMFIEGFYHCNYSYEY